MMGQSFILPPDQILAATTTNHNSNKLSPTVGMTNKPDDNHDPGPSSGQEPLSSGQTGAEASGPAALSAPSSSSSGNDWGSMGYSKDGFETGTKYPKKLPNGQWAIG